MMVASADPDSELAKAFRNQIVLASREQGRSILARAASEMSVRDDISIEVALDMIYGPIFYRLQMGHAKVDNAFVEELVSELVRGIGKT